MKRYFAALTTTALALIGASIFAALGAQPAVAEEDKSAGVSSDAEVLLELFQKKGILTPAEAAEARKAIASRKGAPEAAPETPSLVLNKTLKALQLYGDARLRFERREGRDPDGDAVERDRFRYRLRLGAKGDLGEGFFYGVRLETSDSPRSSNLTFGDDRGPWGKGEDKINVGRLYLGWRPADWLTLEAGRLANPIVSSRLVWDPDLNPEGAAERFQAAFGRTRFFAVFGQFLYDDVDPENPFGTGALRGDAFLLAWQVGAETPLASKATALIAPALYNYTGSGDYGGVYDPASGPPGQTAINDLLVLDVPAEVRFALGPLPVKAFGQLAVNLQGDRRAARARALNPAAYPGSGDENLAWRAGLALGKLGGKKDWKLEAFWMRQELFALDPNLVDSDLYDSVLNFEGLAVSFSYAFTDNIFGSAAYAWGDRANKHLPTGLGGDLYRVGSSLNDYRLVQLDLSWRF